MKSFRFYIVVIAAALALTATAKHQSLKHKLRKEDPALEEETHVCPCAAEAMKCAPCGALQQPR